MFVLMTYDVEAQRVEKALKTARRYLRRVQNSVFEGELTPAGLASLKRDLKSVLDLEADSVLFYTWRTMKSASIELIGPGTGYGTGTATNFI